MSHCFGKLKTWKAAGLSCGQGDRLVVVGRKTRGKERPTQRQNKGRGGGSKRGQGKGKGKENCGRVCKYVHGQTETRERHAHVEKKTRRQIGEALHPVQLVGRDLLVGRRQNVTLHHLVVKVAVVHLCVPVFAAKHVRALALKASQANLLFAPPAPLLVLLALAGRRFVGRRGCCGRTGTGTGSSRRRRRRGSDSGTDCSRCYAWCRRRRCRRRRRRTCCRGAIGCCGRDWRRRRRQEGT